MKSPPAGDAGAGADRPADAGADAPSGADGDTCGGDVLASLDIGQACLCGSQCRSGHCVDGFCCENACEGLCLSCGLPSALGRCSPIAAGVAPSTTECKVDDPGTCGQDGKCDGHGACETYPKGTLCRGGGCQAESVNGLSKCDGVGHCVVAPPVICAPFSCDPSTGDCFSACTTDADCIGGRKCLNGSCGPKMNGTACAASAECASGFCVDQVCCSSDCNGACRACNLLGMEGTCSPLGSGAKDPTFCSAQLSTTCGTTGECDGFGGCAKFPANTICGSAVCAGATTMNTARTCDGLGTCQATEARDCGNFRCVGGLCPSVCTTDSDCKDGHACLNRSCGSKLTDGQVCANNAECANGNCVDGVCCNQPCTGACRSCSSPGSLGRCTLTPSGNADPRNTCVDRLEASCATDGKCDGAGACRNYPTGTVCAAEGCASDVYTPQSTCNASHQCIKPTTQPCSPYRCNGSKCANVCVTDALCVSPPYSCVGNSCGKVGPGTSCSSDAQCVSGHCAQGVCCTTTCTAACQSCAIPGSLGTCSNVQSGTDSRCPAQATSTCGTTGSCSAGQCAKWPATTQCAAASCPSFSTQKPPAKCDGAGTCVATTAASCAPGRCDATSLICTNACTTNADCFPPATCISGSCGLLPKGGTCSSTAQCATGLTCSARDSVCCDTACEGVCETCRPPNLPAGTCTAVQAGAADPSAMCTMAAETTCGFDGKCKGSSAGLTGTQRCRTWDTGTGCRNQSCAAGTLTLASQCDGNGSCPVASTASCGGYTCLNATQCRTSCASDTDCMGVSCNTVTKHCGEKSPVGLSCTLATDCSSGFCADGRCCNTACSGACQMCSASGLCVTVPDSTPEPLCPAAPPCGNTGLCRGGSCEKSATTVTAVAATCSVGQQLIGPTQCNGLGGVGTPPPAANCAGDFVCVGTACKTSCTVDADCLGGKVCSGASCITGSGGAMGSGGATGSGGAAGSGGDTGAAGAGGADSGGGGAGGAAGGTGLGG